MLDRASGSGVFARSVDNFLTLTENTEGKMVFEATRRNAASPPPLEVKFDCPIWTVVGEADPILPRKLGRPTGYDPDSILAAFPDAESSLTTRELRKALGDIPPSTFQRHKKKAIQEEILEERNGLLTLPEPMRVLKRREAAKQAALGAVP